MSQPMCRPPVLQIGLALPGINVALAVPKPGLASMLINVRRQPINQPPVKAVLMLRSLVFLASKVKQPIRERRQLTTAVLALILIHKIIPLMLMALANTVRLAHVPGIMKPKPASIIAKIWRIMILASMPMKILRTQPGVFRPQLPRHPKNTVITLYD